VESPPEGYPRHLPPLREPLPHILHMTEGKCQLQVRDLLARFSCRGGQGDLQNGAIRYWIIGSTANSKPRKPKLFCSFVILTRFAYLLLVAFGKLRRIYIQQRGYKREPEPAASPQSTTLHSTVNTSVKKEVGHSNTRGKVSLCSFPAEKLLHIVYIFNILCGLKVIE
jgi:hypothetical protein